MLSSQFQKLRDDDLRKINATLQADFMSAIKTYRFPCCSKGGNHAACNVCFVEEQKNQGNAKPSQIFNLKQLLVDSYSISIDQCHPNSFEECIKPTLVQLEDSLKQLLDLKERLGIYCEQLAEKIITLSLKAQMFPPIRVRDSLNSIKESARAQSEDEKNSIIANELSTLAELLNIEGKGIPVVKGGSIDVGLFYLLAQKAKSDASILSQCLDKSCFVLNDIDHAENNPAYAAKLISNFKALKSTGSLKEPAYQDYKRRMAHVGLSEADLQVDKTIDFSVIYLYEKHKLQGFTEYNSNSQQGIANNLIARRKKEEKIGQIEHLQQQEQLNYQQQQLQKVNQQQRNEQKPPEQPVANLNMKHNFNSNSSNNELLNDRSNINVMNNHSVLQQQQDNLLLKKRAPIFQKKESSLQSQKRDLEQQQQQHQQQLFQEQQLQQQKDYLSEH